MASLLVSNPDHPERVMDEDLCTPGGAEDWQGSLLLLMFALP